MSTEREAFERYWWSSLVTPTDMSKELLHSCEFAAWYAWQERAALAQPAREPLTNEQIDDLIAAEWSVRNGTTHDALRRIARAVLAAAQEKP